MEQDELMALARTRAKDPVQEHLREHKAVWNAKISKLLGALIELKRGINGQPVPKLGLNEKGKITEPIPDLLVSASKELKTYVDDAFNDLASIISEQQQYVEYRAHEKERKLQEQSVPANDTTALPAAANVDDGIVKEASNPFTRLWSYVKTPFQFSDKDRFARMKMLRAASNIEEQLLEIESLIVSKDRDSIPNLIYSFSQPLINQYLGGLVEPLIDLAKKKQELLKVPEVEAPVSEQPVATEQFVPPANISIPESIKPPEQPAVEQPPLSIEDIERMKKEISDHNMAVTNILEHIDKFDPADKKAINIQRNLVNRSKKAFHHAYAAKNAFDMVKFYKEHNERLAEFYKMYEQLKGKQSTAALEAIIVKEAASFALTRWLKRKRLPFWNSQENRLRLDADESIRTARRDVDRLMDVLEEKSAPIQRIANILLILNQTLSDLYKNLARLAELHNSRELMTRYEARSEGKRQSVEIIPENKINYIKRLANDLATSATSIALKKMQEEPENE